jgi:hypothetical protein
MVRRAPNRYQLVRQASLAAGAAREAPPALPDLHPTTNFILMVK